jgi:hypothetical protein
LVDTSTPNVARMFNHYLGGRETFQVDRDTADQVLAALPETRPSAIGAKEFSARAVKFLAAEEGIGQFLDLGVGLPAKVVLHEVARRVNPDARFAYVDHDPVVVSHGRHRRRAATARLPGRALHTSCCYQRRKDA